MKKAISLFLTITILVAVLSACGASQQNVNVWQDAPSVPQTNERLTVFCVGDLRDSGMIELALNRYRQLYPDIQVELIKPESENIEEREELYQQVAAQIMAGEGPDGSMRKAASLMAMIPLVSRPLVPTRSAPLLRFPRNC